MHKIPLFRLLKTPKTLVITDPWRRELERGPERERESFPSDENREREKKKNKAIGKNVALETLRYSAQTHSSSSLLGSCEMPGKRDARGWILAGSAHFRGGGGENGVPLSTLLGKWLAWPFTSQRHFRHDTHGRRGRDPSYNGRLFVRHFIGVFIHSFWFII